MAQHYGPHIVTDGLVLCLDAADKNSYNGGGAGNSSAAGGSGIVVVRWEILWVILQKYQKVL